MNDAEMLERVAVEVRGFVERKFAPPDRSPDALEAEGMPTAAVTFGSRRTRLWPS